METKSDFYLKKFRVLNYKSIKDLSFTFSNDTNPGNYTFSNDILIGDDKRKEDFLEALIDIKRDSNFSKYGKNMAVGDKNISTFMYEFRENNDTVRFTYFKDSEYIYKSVLEFNNRIIGANSSLDEFLRHHYFHLIENFKIHLLDLDNLLIDENGKMKLKIKFIRTIKDYLKEIKGNEHYKSEFIGFIDSLKGDKFYTLRAYLNGIIKDYFLMYVSELVTIWLFKQIIIESKDLKNHLFILKDENDYMKLFENKFVDYFFSERSNQFVISTSKKPNGTTKPYFVIYRNLFAKYDNGNKRNGVNNTKKNNK